MDEHDFFNWLAVSRHLSAGSLRTTRVRFNYLRNWLAGRELNPTLVQDFILECRDRKLKNSTINGYIRIFTLFDKFYAAKEIKSELTKGMEYFPKNYRVPTILSVDEIQAIVNAPLVREASFVLPAERLAKLSLTMKLAVWFLGATGCRIDEMASLTKSNLYLGLDCNYAQFVDTKTYLDRKVPLPPTLAFELQDYVKEKKPKDLVFLSPLGNKIVEQTFNKYLREKVEMAGVNKHVYAHCFRNSYIMEHLRCGTDVLTIAKLVGHADVNTTMGYTKFNYGMLEKGAENHPLFARALTTEKLLKRIVETIEKWPILLDHRFSFRREIRPNSILFEIYLK